MPKFEAYYDPAATGSFQGATGFLRQFKGKQKQQAKKWLREQRVYKIHTPVRRKFKRTKYVTSGIRQQFEADLVDLSSLKAYNDNHKFLLTIIDVFSKKARVVPILTKSGKSVSEALDHVFSDWAPRSLRTDRGKEFLNSLVQNVLKKYNVHFFTSHSDDIKCSVIERLNRQILSKLFRYFSKANTKTYLDILPKIVESYNNTFHRAIGMAPNRVNAQNSEAVFLKLQQYKASELYSKQSYFKGDLVRISRSRKLFDKGYLAKWSEELFKIDRVKKTIPVTYELVDLSGEKITGIFYEAELIKAKLPSYFDIEKILDKRGNRYLVKWAGYPVKFNSWVSDFKIK